ncbi:helix-turn-helix domain-containing protein [Nocardia sp. NPDC004068]|uniref:helix-turn-helix domain-containing protein n=1 Tax=Nocardia sp. NPDC004068 TaxID=3364303 RepID=UPI0036BB4982
MTAEGSTFAQRTLGQQLRALREKAKVSQAQAGEALGASPQTIGRLEEGFSWRSANDLRMNALCDLYNASDEERKVILALARETRIAARRGGGWWQPHLDRNTTEFDLYAAAEEQAVRLTAWAVIRLPVLVRTPEYCRAVAWTESPNAPAEQIEARVQRELKRQARLQDPAFTAEVFVSEAALREEWGGPAVMADQHDYLAEMNDLPNVSIRLVPFATRTHIGALIGSFSLLEFPTMPNTRMTQPPIVHIEEHVGDLYLERAKEVAPYQSAVAKLRRSASTRLARADSETPESVR